jgi:hypothetical protein
MSKISARQAALGAAVAAFAVTLAPAARAEDFLSTLFSAFGAPPPQQAPVERMPYANEGNPSFAPQPEAARPRAVTYGGGHAYCVRTCDGRYFPLPDSDRESRATSCNSFCPASKTEVVYGGTIDEATAGNGKPYSELPNAFRYRNEIVAGCTCNGKDQFGLAPVRIEDDPTLRKGDLVAGANGLMVASRVPEGRSASLNFTPASKSIAKSVLARYERVPVLARE